MAPSSSVSETLFTAVRPPNCTVMLLASSALGIPPPHDAALEFAHDAAGHEEHHQHYQQAVDEQVGLREGGAEEFAGESYEGCPDERPEERAAPADDGYQRDPHGEVQFEHG